MAPDAASAMATIVLVIFFKLCPLVLLIIWRGVRLAKGSTGGQGGANWLFVDLVGIR